jgi:hypothetical protein
MIDRRDPRVIRFIRVAEMHRDAATALIETLSRRSASRAANVVIYLTGYILECSLKAWMISLTPVGKREMIVKQFRGRKAHDLRMLGEEIRQRNRVIPDRIAKGIRLIASVWSTEIRYDPRNRRHDDAALCLRSATDVMKAILGE